MEKETFKIQIDNYSGPLDVLLDLAKSQKVDLVDISITQLVDQFIDFISNAKKLNLDLASEYLLMATWLTYLKSKLLLPQIDDDDDFQATEVAKKLKLPVILIADDRLGAINQVLLSCKAIEQYNLKVAGTLDCLAYYNGKLTVFDFKTTRKNLNIRIDHLIQCSAYSTMFSNYSGIPVEQIAVAQVTKIGFNTQIKIEKPQNYFHLFEQKLKYYYKMKNDLNIR